MNGSKFEELELGHDEASNVLTVRMNRTHRLNALSFQMGCELMALCSALREEPASSTIRCVMRAPMRADA